MMDSYYQLKWILTLSNRIIKYKFIVRLKLILRGVFELVISICKSMNNKCFIYLHFFPCLTNPILIVTYDSLFRQLVFIHGHFLEKQWSNIAVIILNYSKLLLTTITCTNCWFYYRYKRRFYNERKVQARVSLFTNRYSWSRVSKWFVFKEEKDSLQNDV